MVATGLDTELIKILQQIKEKEMSDREEKMLQNENRREKNVAMYTTKQ